MSLIFVSGVFPFITLFVGVISIDDGSIGSTVTAIASVPLTIGSPETILLEAGSVKRLSVDTSEAFYIFEAHTLNLGITFLNGHGVKTTSPAVYTSWPWADLVNQQPFNLSVIVFVRAYDAGNLIPGCCNPQQGSPYKPFLSLTWTQPIVQLEFYQAGWNEHTCESIASLQYNIYEFFLPENECSFASLETGYNNFLVDVVNKGHHVATHVDHSTRVNFTNYPRTGRIVAVIVSNETSSAIYGLAHTYGCQIVFDDVPTPNNKHTNGCQVHNSIGIGLSCALGVFVGLALTFCGHRFFKCSQFLYGFYLGSLIGYTVVTSLALPASPRPAVLLVLTCCCGLLFAAISVSLWCLLGVPVAAVILPTLELGVFLAAMLMYLPPLCGETAFNNDSTYWLVFICISLGPTIFLIAFTQKASIIASVTLGTLTVILSIDQFTGSTLKFIFGNVFNRLFVNNFGRSLRCPPLQKTDLLLLTCLLGITALGLVVQLIVERRRAPFPPGPFQQWRWARQQQQQGEHTPLLGDNSVSGGQIDSGSGFSSEPQVVGYIQVQPHNTMGQQHSHGRGYRTSTNIKHIQATGQSNGGNQQKRDIFSPSASTA